jgi:hypothetical protein
MGRAGVALRKSNDTAAIAGRATASMVVAGREPAQQKCSTGMSHRTDSSGTRGCRNYSDIPQKR